MSSEQTFGGPSGANNSTIEYAETAKINGVVGKKTFNLDSSGNILDFNNALKLTVVGAVTYIGIAQPGSAEASAVWQCKKIDTNTGVVITWADGDTLFNNVATDLTALTYV